MKHIIEKLDDYVAKKLISEESHPERPEVKIYNYTQMCQFSGAWDEVTKICRGLIVNRKTGDIIARPFEKFFNYQEHISKGLPLPLESPLISEKVDGSLGILYELDGQEWISTRGSFTSTQAIWATNWWRKNVPAGLLKNLHEYTYLFEIVFPENKIVVNYDFSGLVFLGAINKNTGYSVVDLQVPSPIRSTKIKDTINIEQFLTMNESNEEGVVLFYPETNLRLKIKYPEYVRLHRLATGTTPRSIWEHLSLGKPMSELIANVPDELFFWMSSIATKIISDYKTIEEEVQRTYENIKILPTRKERALAIHSLFSVGKGGNHIDARGSAVFALLDNKHESAKKIIWGMVKPATNKETFIKELDG